MRNALLNIEKHRRINATRRQMAKTRNEELDGIERQRKEKEEEERREAEKRRKEEEEEEEE